MTFDDIRYRLLNHGYETKLEYPKSLTVKPGHVYDRLKTVVWNEEQYDKEKSEHEKRRKDYNDDVQRLHNEFDSDVISCIEREIGKHNQAKQAFYYAWSEGHSSGMYNVLQIVEELVEILKIKD